MANITEMANKRAAAGLDPANFKAYVPPEASGSPYGRPKQRARKVRAAPSDVAQPQERSPEMVALDMAAELSPTSRAAEQLPPESPRLQNRFCSAQGFNVDFVVFRLQGCFFRDV